jgi:preprotein translocase subunit YajC
MTFTNVFAADAQQGSMWPSLIIMALFLVAMWFLIIAPQRKRMKEQEKMINSLKPGDKVLTSGGIYGTIQSIKGDRITVKIDDNAHVEVAKAFISTVVDDADEKK